MPDAASSILILLLLFIPLALVIAIILFYWVKSLKINLKKNETIIKEGYMTYEGRNVLMPFILSGNYGKIYLTNKRLVLKYIRFLEHKIEILLENIKSVNVVTLAVFPMLKVDFLENGEIKSVYFYPRPSSINPFVSPEEWRDEIENILPNRSI